MAETLLSPGVLTRENDQSQITQGPIIAGAAIVGPTVKGPVRIPTLVTSYSDYINKFGGSFVSGGTSNEYLTSISAYNYFQQGGNTLLVTRVVSGTFAPASASVNSGITGIDGVYATGSLNISNFTNLDTGSFIAIRFATPDIDFYIIPNTSGYEAVDNISSTRFFYTSLNSGSTYTLDQWGTQIAQIVNTGSWDLYEYFSASYDTGTDTFAFSGSVAGTAANSYKVYRTTTVGGVGTLTASLAGGAAGTPSIAFTLETLSWGAIQNSTGSTGNNNTLVNGTPDNIRWEVANNDTTNGTFSLLIRRGDDNINSKIILESYAGLSLDSNSPNYIEAVIGNQTINTDNGYTDITGDYTNKSRYVRVKSVSAPTPNYFDNNGVAKPEYTASIPLNASGSFGGANGTLAAVYGLSNNDYTSSINLLANQDEFRYNVITVPGLYQSINSAALSLLLTNTQNRGDAIAVVDLVSKDVNNINTVVSEASEIDNSYAAAYWPWVQVNAPNTGKLTWVPPSTIIPSVYAYNDRIAAPWFAPGGFTRGGLSVIQAAKKLSPSDRDTLYLGKVNPIATFPGQGVVAYGQKTLQQKASALDRINVRRLLIELKSFIGQIANTLVFEQNTLATRNRFLSQVNPYLDSIQQRQGLFAFKVVMDDTNNTADVIDRNQLVGQIFIQPTRTAEFIVLDFNVTPTGATF
jgi:phage tail sheath protein FI